MAKVQKYLICIALIFFACACSRIELKAHKEPAAIPVQTMVVSSLTVHSTSRYVGVIEAVRETPLSMQATGRVLDLGCKDGERVRKGQILIAIDSTRAVNSLRAAEASLQHAQDGYNRAKPVHEKGGISDQQMVEIESQLTQAQSVYALAKEQVEECTLRAPFDGVVSGFNLSVGQTVLPGVRLFSLLDISALAVRFSVPEGEIGAVHKGAKGTMECPAVNTTRPITVTEISVSANQITHSYNVTARINGSTENILPAMVAKVMLTNGDEPHGQGAPTADDLIIPAHCVLLMPQGPTVWVVEQGRAQRRNIVVDGYYAEGVRVTEGLREGDTLIVEGYQKLYNDCRITIQ